MGTYAWVSFALVLVLGAVLWWGADEAAPLQTRVSLAAGWEGALLEGVAGSWELRAGVSQELPEGRYRLTLFATDGQAVRDTVEVGGEALVVGGASDG